jgi:multicomponent Na+:H+ antiporter subunit D
MSSETILLLVLGAPVLQAALLLALPRPPGLRDVIHILFSLAIACGAVNLALAASDGQNVRVVLARPLPNVDLAFSIEPLGALMAAVLTSLGALHAIHAAGVVRAERERSPARLLACIALAMGAVAAVSYSANLLTLFVAYEILILAAFPLVAHRGDEQAQKGARTFLATLLASSMGLFLPAMIWTYALAGALDFQAGGMLLGRVDAISANILLTLFALGLAMTAMPPLHIWAPRIAQSSFPALVVVLALAVLPAGGIGVLKIAAYVFGPVMQDARWAANGLIALAGAGMCVAAIVALSKQDARERFAYSCMAQTLSIVMGALLALPAGLFAASLQVVALACAGMTLLMAAGTTAAITGRVAVADYAGLGRIMPWTFAGFAVASASMIGLPPFAGAWAKLWLITAAAGSGLLWGAALAAVAAILTFAHLGPLAANAFAGRPPPDAFKRPDGASILLAAPVIAGAAATLSLLVLADPLAGFLAPMWTPAP